MRVHLANQENMQLTVEKRIVEARLMLQADTEKELKIEKEM